MNALLDHQLMEPDTIPMTDLSGMPEAFQRAYGPTEPYANEIGDFVRQDADLMPYQGCRSINPRSRGSCRIFAVFPDLPSRKPRTYGLESQVEYHNLAITLVDPTVAQVYEQVGPVPFVGDAGKPATHFFDLVITEKGGRRIAVAVKPTDRLASSRFMRELNQLAKTMPTGLVDELRLVTEQSFSRSDAFNAIMYLRFSLTPDFEADGRLTDALSSVNGAMTIGDICRLCKSGGRSFKAVVRAIFEGKLKKISKGRINLFTIVEKRS
ncbi:MULTISPECIES: hypothetical protein [unclassified Yoonia]|uniref:hypothetical protein n=1 Tax=unclassified Yoonia TaxID=2629118 RepID=UPI002B001F5E|nr:MULTISPECIES: hypothetical protein [unclassified Yoonia]